MSTLRYRELVILHDPWETEMRQLLTQRQSVATGSLRIGRDLAQPHLLAHQLTVVRQMPHGADLPPLTDWCVLVIGDAPGRDPAVMLREIQPLPSQRCVVLVLSVERPGEWAGAVSDRGTTYPLNDVRFIGPKMLHLTRDPTHPLEPHAQLRWSRTVGALGGDLWRKMHQSHVVLIGCGRNGTQLAWQLAGLGVVRWTLVDPDRLGVENLDAMPGLELADVGRYKVEALADRLLASNPEMCITCHAGPVNELLDRIRSRANLIITCVDDDTPRVAGSWLSREMLAPQLEIGTSIQLSEFGSPTQQGDVRLLLPYQGCVQCAGGLANPKQTFYELAAPPGSLHRGTPTVWTAQRAGSLVHINAVTVGCAVELWLSLMRGETGSAWLRLDAETGGGWRIRRSEVTADVKCEMCKS